jgi:tRNA threonylcarbamoyladenosine biosynthesis protein TsaE
MPRDSTPVFRPIYLSEAYFVSVMTFKKEITNESQLPEAAAGLIEYAGGRKIFLFEGEMGSGKTTFIKAICNFLGVKDGLSSPTYSIVNEYNTTDGKRICHFDLYRLKNLQECLDIGMEDYLDSGDYCFVEWPKIAERIYPDNAVSVKIGTEKEKRLISAN